MALVNLLGLRRRRLPLQHLDEFSWEPAFAALARPTFPPLGLDLHPRIDLHARARIQLAHHGHDLVLLQTELRRRRRLERVHRARKRELRWVEGREGLLALLVLVLVLRVELELLLLLLLLFLLLSSRVIGEEFDELVHGIGDAEQRDEEEDERLLARVGRRGLLRRTRGGALHGAAIEELAELAAHLRAISGEAAAAATAGEDVAEPADEAEEAEHAAEGVAELGELVDDAGEGEEGRVGGHEGRLEHLREAGEGLHDRVQERERRRGRRLERLRHARVRRVERRHAAWLPPGAAEHAHPAAVRAWVHAVHAVHAVAVAGVPAERAHATVQGGGVGREGVCAAEAVVWGREGGGKGGGHRRRCGRGEGGGTGGDGGRCGGGRGSGGGRGGVWCW